MVSARRVGTAIAILFAASWPLACGGGGRSDYAGAGATAAAAVGGAGIHRATTGGCWGQCLNGLVCDRESGTCIARPPCGGRCAASETCQREKASERCVERGAADAGTDAS